MTSTTALTTGQLATLLLERRKKLRLTRAYVAELAGLSGRQLAAWEAGRVSPGFGALQRVLHVLGLELSIAVRANV